jgi:hypothetical protein
MQGQGHLKLIKYRDFVQGIYMYISYTHGGILMKLHIHHYEKQCNVHEPGL